MKKIDELKAEIENAERELENKKEELRQIESIKSLEIGDYIETTFGVGRIVGRLVEISGGYGYIRYSIETLPHGTILIGSPIEKWQPKRGDLCIFWNNEFKDCSYINVFSIFENGMYADKNDVDFDNCIPFISEQQFKEHIGYEEC